MKRFYLFAALSFTILSEAKVALVTGANSGIGLETAKLLYEKEWETIYIGSRSEAKCQEAMAAITSGVSPRLLCFTAELTQRGDIERAVGQLSKPIDALILNAGGFAPNKPKLLANGFEMTFSINLLGHYHLTEALRQRHLLSQKATVVFSSSEAALGIHRLGIERVNFRELAKQRFKGDLKATILAFSKGEPHELYNEKKWYGATKQLGNIWMQYLATQLPTSSHAFAVSPGACAGTGVTKQHGGILHFLGTYLGPWFANILPFLHSAQNGAMRYLEVIERPTAFHNGAFYASAPGSLVGKLVEMCEKPDSDLTQAVIDVLNH